MKYEAICLAVKDVKASKKFYTELMGLEIETDWGANVGFIGGIALQQDFHQLLGFSEKSMIQKSHNMELVFETEDFDGFLEKLEKHPNVELVKNGVTLQPWGQRVIHLYDLDGHILEVGEKILHVIRRFVDEGMTAAQVSERMGIPVIDVNNYLNDMF